MCRRDTCGALVGRAYLNGATNETYSDAFGFIDAVEESINTTASILTSVTYLTSVYVFQSDEADK
jgi:hypothetical protein